MNCSNDQGAILVDPEGGFGPYTIALTNTDTGQSYTQNNVEAFLFEGLSAGDFTIAITDTGGCTTSFVSEITLIQPTPLLGSVAPSIDLTCYNDNNGVLTATVTSGGFGTVQYRLHQYDTTNTTILTTTPYQTTNSFNNLAAGNYAVEFLDEANCSVLVPASITNPNEVLANLIQLNPLTCTTTAQIELSASGGTGPYQYSTDGINYTPMSGGNSHVFDVVAGTFQYYIQDSFGCASNISNQVSIDAVPNLELTIDESAAIINCSGESTATIRANATGGLGNYEFTLYSDAALTNIIIGPQTNDTFANLPSGTYYIGVESVDCMASTSVVIAEPIPLQVNQTLATDVTCNGLNDGTISVDVSGGTGTIYYAITPNLDQFDTENTFTDLSPGTYDVIAQDENGCFIPFTFVINQPDALTVEAVNSTPEICMGDSNGAFDIVITGGTAPYSTSLNSNNSADYQPNVTTFSNLSAGQHVVFVRDAEGCETNITVTIEPGTNLNATVAPIYLCTTNIPDNSLDIIFEDPTVIADVLYALDSTDPNDYQINPDYTNIAPGSHYLTVVHSSGCLQTIDFEIEDFEPLVLNLSADNLNEITATAEGGSAPYTYYFDGVDNGEDNTFRINRTDTYTVTVVDQNGCEVTADIFMEFIDIEIPPYFTPNGDSLNDTWAPRNMEGFPEILTILYDRYGRELYRIELNSSPWNGVYQGNELPSGDYWYVIRLRGENDDREFIGHFTLYR